MVGQVWKLMRWILHVDMNSYFASVEQQSNPNLRNKPIGVGGKPGTRSVITAASIEAKARGVKTAMGSWEALRICPELIIVEPSYKKYQYYSERIFGILESVSPRIEIFSIDEAFIELTELERAPTQQIANYIGSVVSEIKLRIRKEIGSVVTATIGVGHGKRLAKLAGEVKKPDGFVVILNDDEQQSFHNFQRIGALTFTGTGLFKKTDIQTLPGIGPRLGRRLRAHGIHTLFDMAQLGLDDLKKIVFPYEKELFLTGLGIDTSPVTPYWQQAKEKSIGHQYTLPRDEAVVDLPPILARLAEKIGRRLRQKNFVAHRLNLYLRTHNRGNWSSYQNSTKQIESDQDIYKLTWKIISRALADPSSGLRAFTQIRMPSITLVKLKPKTSASIPFLKQEKREINLTKTLDLIRDNYGDRSILSGLSLGTKMHYVPDGRRNRFSPKINYTEH